MRKKVVFALAVTISALLLRWYASITLPTDYDEPVYYTAARYYADALRKGQLERIPEVTYNYEHPILAKLIYGTVLSWVPSDGPLTDDVWAFFIFQTPLAEAQDPFRIFLLRQISVGFGALAALVVGLVSPLAGLFLAIDSIAIKFTSVIYLEALPLCLTAMSIFLFGAAVEGFRTKDDVSFQGHGKQIALLIVSALCLGVSAAAKYQYGVAGLACLIYYIFWVLRLRPAQVSRYLFLLAFGLTALLAFFAADPYLWPSPLGRLIHSLQYSLDYSHGETVRSAGYPFYQPLLWLSSSVPAFVHRTVQPMPSRGPEFIFRLDALIFGLGIIGLPRLFKVRPLIFIWLITSVAFLLIWNTKWPQYALLAVAPLCISASEGFSTLGRLFLRLVPKKTTTLFTSGNGKVL
jgi:hypothetical protein